MQSTQETSIENPGKPPLRRRQFSLRTLFGAIFVVGVILGLTNHWAGGAIFGHIASPILIAAIIIGSLMLIQLPVFLLLRESGVLPSPDKDSRDEDSAD